jgi:extradiol dioxygenase family protein
MNKTLHLSLGVKSLEESLTFYTQCLGATVAHRDISGYVNLELWGCQLTLKENKTNTNPGEQLPDFHFGFNLSLTEFESLTNLILLKHRERVVKEPAWVDQDSTLKRKKIYLKCPSGYLIELKAYA